MHDAVWDPTVFWESRRDGLGKQFSRCDYAIMDVVNSDPTPTGLELSCPESIIWRLPSSRPDTEILPCLGQDAESM